MAHVQPKTTGFWSISGPQQSRYTQAEDTSSITSHVIRRRPQKHPQEPPLLAGGWLFSGGAQPAARLCTFGYVPSGIARQRLLKPVELPLSACWLRYIIQSAAPGICWASQSCSSDHRDHCDHGTAGERETRRRDSHDTIRARLPPTLARHPTLELTAWPQHSILAPLASGMSYRQQ